MTARNQGLSLIVFTGDPRLVAQLEEDLHASSVNATLTVVKDVAAMHRAAARRGIDGVIIETKRGRAKDVARVQQAVDPARTFILAGSRGVLRNAATFMLSNGRGAAASLSALSHSTFEDYLDSKLGEFVRGMKNGSARNLHPMLIKAMERPLITHALKETNGNQIKTAHLLGMNRNTLRKKITELRIPVQRVRRAPS